MQQNSVWKMFGGGSSNYNAILDKFTSLDNVTNAIRQAGLESCNLIFGKLVDIGTHSYNTILIHYQQHSDESRERIPEVN